MPRIVFIDASGVRREIEAAAGQSLMEAARASGIDAIEARCGGAMTCATCHVYVDPEWAAKLPAPMSDEKDLLVELTHYGERSRLSCQIDFTPALDGLKVTIAPDE